MFNTLARLMTPSADRQRAHALYLALVEQSRNPFFYSELQVPDTLDGRFELIVLHGYLLLHRLKSAHGGQFDRKESGLEQVLIETLFEDMDRSLREIGVGDLGVGRRVKTMANAFYGRMNAYEKAQGDDMALSDALHRNVYAMASVSPEKVAALLSYVRAAIGLLQATPIEAVQAGEFRWPEPAGPDVTSVGR